jgi:hypothetical protein
MRIRDVYLLNAQSLNDSDTVIVPLTRSLKILSLRIQYQDQNGSTSNTLDKLNDQVSKFAVVDGSDVLHSLSMREEQAWNCFQRGRFPYQALSGNDDDVIVEEAFIDFRRYVGDTQFYLDTSKFTNPQLQLTHALTISSTAGFVTGDGKLSVIARVIDSGAPSQLGFMMAKEVDSFASTASGDHNTDLPLDWPIAAILVQDPVNGNTPDNYLSNFKLTADTDSYIPVNISWTDLLKLNFYEYGKFLQSMRYLEDTAATLKFDTYSEVQANVSISDSVGLPEIESIAGNQVVLAMTTGGDPAMSVEARGIAPHASVIYHFGDGKSSDQIFSPQGVGKFQLKLTGANTGATPKVVTIQQHP